MDGFLNVLKPPGVTSHDVVLSVRNLFGEMRAGHLGTLDPLARGVLPLALGAYRRLSEYFLEDTKQYMAEFLFGTSTDSGDLDGRIVDEKDAGFLRPEDVQKALAGFTGVVSQEPPAFSALKVGGKRMYKLARSGFEVRHESRNVQVHEFGLLGWVEGSRPKGYFRMSVGRGTYVRSLAMDLGKALGVGATVSYLLREKSGLFMLKDSFTLSDLKKAASDGHFLETLSDPLGVLPGIAKFQVAPHVANKIAHGVELSASDFLNPACVQGTGAGGLFLAYGENPVGGARILAVIRRQNGRFKYHKVLIRESDSVANIGRRQNTHR